VHRGSLLDTPRAHREDQVNPEGGRALEPWFRLAVMIILPLMTVLFRRDFRGTEHVPRTGGVILAVNHLSYADPFAVALFVYKGCGRRPRFMAKHTLFTLPLAGRIVRGAKQIPVYRNTADAGDALRAAVDAVNAGECVVIYPEATVTKDPDLWPMAAKTGVARLALATGAPVVPVGQWGAQEFLGLDKKPHPLPRKTIHLHAGPPVDLSAWAGAEPSSEVLRAMTTRVMNDVAALVGGIREAVPPATPFVPQRRPAADPADDTRRSA
jgi:1-acyl-sn-glycerol-3-phosphate acyltransferase